MGPPRVTKCSYGSPISTVKESQLAILFSAIYRGYTGRDCSWLLIVQQIWEVKCRCVSEMASINSSWKSTVWWAGWWARIASPKWNSRRLEWASCGTFACCRRRLWLRSLCTFWANSRSVWGGEKKARQCLKVSASTVLDISSRHSRMKDETRWNDPAISVVTITTYESWDPSIYPLFIQNNGTLDTVEEIRLSTWDV